MTIEKSLNLARLIFGRLALFFLQSAVLYITLIWACLATQILRGRLDCDWPGRPLLVLASGRYDMFIEAICWEPQRDDMGIPYLQAALFITLVWQLFYFFRLFWLFLSAEARKRSSLELGEDRLEIGVNLREWLLSRWPGFGFRATVFAVIAYASCTWAAAYTLEDYIGYGGCRGLPPVYRFIMWPVFHLLLIGRGPLAVMVYCILLGMCAAGLSSLAYRLWSVGVEKSTRGEPVATDPHDKMR